MKCLIFLSLLTLCACARSIPVVPPTLTFDQQLFIDEGIHCPDLMLHDADAPMPDCETVVAALRRGRTDAATFYPRAVDVKLNVVSLYATKQVWSAAEDFPRMPLGPMALTLGTSIQYAFPEALEHEFVHVVATLLDGQRRRTDEAIMNPLDADQLALGFVFFKDITCHNTTDDPFGHGLSLSASGRAGCIRPYAGPKGNIK